MFPKTLLAWLVVTLLGIPTAAAPAPNGEGNRSSSPSSSAGNNAALTGPLRDLLVQNLPTPLYEASWDWGRTARVTTGVKWTGKALDVHPQATKGDRNDGTWKKVRITAENLPDGLVFELRNIQHPEPERTTFEVFMAFDARVEYEQQKWKAGFRLYSGTARARLRVQIVLNCELVTRLEWNDKIVPDAVFRLRVVRSSLTYDHLVVEHIAGVGGDVAKLLGEAIQHGIHRWRPSLERNLLAKANAAIEKAADTKEVRIGLGSLLKP
jgi:hypothetical protein